MSRRAASACASSIVPFASSSSTSIIDPCRWPQRTPKHQSCGASDHERPHEERQNAGQHEQEYEPEHVSGLSSIEGIGDAPFVVRARAPSHPAESASGSCVRPKHRRPASAATSSNNIGPRHSKSVLNWTGGFSSTKLP